MLDVLKMKVINERLKDARNKSFVVQLVPGEFFVIVNQLDYIVKLNIQNSEGTKQYKFIKNKKSVISKISGSGGVGSDFLSQNLMGDQFFEKWITCIEYVDGYTLIGFSDGKILKIKGTGGSGRYMFNVVETPNGFKQYDLLHLNYLEGSHKFNNQIIDIVHVEGKTLICFEKGKILKINGSGGSGYNLFAINETATSFSNIPGYNYLVGYQILDACVTNITVVKPYTFLAFNDGRQIKIMGTGGNGENMFAIYKMNYGYRSIIGYNYLIGSAKFNGNINKSLVVNEKIIFSFDNGYLIKINGTGGSGQNMFNIKENNSGFETYSLDNAIYLLGDFKIPDGSYARDLKFVDGDLYVVLSTEFLIRITGLGGTGHNMFNLVYKKTGLAKFEVFASGSKMYTTYFVGQQNFKEYKKSFPIQLTQINEFIFVAYADERGNTYVLKLKLNLEVEFLKNMFGLSNIYTFASCYFSNGSLLSSYIGCQIITRV